MEVKKFVICQTCGKHIPFGKTVFNWEGKNEPFCSFRCAHKRQKVSYHNLLMRRLNEALAEKRGFKVEYDNVGFALLPYGPAMGAEEFFKKDEEYCRKMKEKKEEDVTKDVKKGNGEVDSR